MAASIPRPDLDALAAGRHADPFAVLGPHEVKGGLAIRVFRPHAKGIEVVDAAVGRNFSSAAMDAAVGRNFSSASMTRIHPEGLF